MANAGSSLQTLEHLQTGGHGLGACGGQGRPDLEFGVRVTHGTCSSVFPMETAPDRQQQVILSIQGATDKSDTYELPSLCCVHGLAQPFVLLH